jgi:hypothetical protein
MPPGAIVAGAAGRCTGYLARCDRRPPRRYNSVEMDIYHDPYCDEQHTPRQRCNDALAPPPPPAAAFDINPVESTVEPEDTVEPRPSSALREAVATAEMPPPAPDVSRAWERTAAAVEATPDSNALGAGHDERPARSTMRIAIVALALVAAWLVVRAPRPRPRE